jgi:anti-anti-sigma factor
MRIETSTDNACVRLVLSGALINTDAESLTTTIAELLHSGYRTFLLDLRDVPWVDSAGLGALVRAYTDVGRGGGTLKLIGVSKALSSKLNLTNLLRPLAWREHRGAMFPEITDPRVGMLVGVLAILLTVLITLHRDCS